MEISAKQFHDRHCKAYYLHIQISELREKHKTVFLKTSLFVILTARYFNNCYPKIKFMQVFTDYLQPFTK